MKQLFYIILLTALVPLLSALYCGGHYKGLRGVITSPNFPFSYSRSLYCLFTIKLPGKRIHIKWNYFNVPGIMPNCNNDFVRIASCTSPWSYNVRYCNSTIPNNIFSSDNCIRIEFRSTTRYINSARNKGFKLSYQALDTNKSVIRPNSNCLDSQVFNDKSINNISLPYYVNVFTPSWPLSYSGHVTQAVCKRRIYLKPRTRVKIHFMDIDLYRPDKTRHSCWENGNDHLVIKGVTDTRSYSFIYCGQRKPFSVAFNRHFRYVEISFVKRSNGSHNNKGFVLGLAIFKDGVRKATHRFVLPLIPTVIAFALMSTLTFAAVRHLRRRYQTPQRLRAYMQRTHDELHDGNEVIERVQITPNPYTLPPPPPYSAQGYPMATTNANSGQFLPNPSQPMGSGVFRTVEPTTPNSQQTSFDIQYPNVYPAAPPPTAQPLQYPASYPPPTSPASYPPPATSPTAYPNTNPFQGMSGNPPQTGNDPQSGNPVTSGMAPPPYDSSVRAPANQMQNTSSNA